MSNRHAGIRPLQPGTGGPQQFRVPLTLLLHALLAPVSLVTQWKSDLSHAGR